MIALTKCLLCNEILRGNGRPELRREVTYHMQADHPYVWNSFREKKQKYFDTIAHEKNSLVAEAAKLIDKPSLLSGDEHE